MSEKIHSIPAEQRRFSRRSFVVTGAAGFTGSAIIWGGTRHIMAETPIGTVKPSEFFGDTTPPPSSVPTVSPSHEGTINPSDFTGMGDSINPTPTEANEINSGSKQINPEDFSGSSSNNEPPVEPTTTPEPTQEPMTQPTPTPEPIPTQEPIPTLEPTMEPTTIPETTSSLVERYENAGADFEKMDLLVEVSKQVVAEMDETEYEYGWCLKGVQDALMKVDLQVFEENPDGTILRDANNAPLRPGSAYRMLHLLNKDFRFAKIDAKREEFPNLLPGTVIVWDKDPSSGDAGAQQHGHIEICWENGIRASSYVNNNSEIPFFELNSDFAVFVPKENPYGTKVPEYPSTTDEYVQKINTAFGLTMKGFDTSSLTPVWEKLWSVSETKFARLITGTTFEAVRGSGSEQINTHLVTLGTEIKEQFIGPITTHESGHVIYNRYLDILLPRIQEAYENEGPISTYGEVGFNKYPNDVRRFHEDFADTIMYFLNPLFVVSSQNLTADHPNYLYDPTNPKPLHKKLAEDILLGNLLLKD